MQEKDNGLHLTDILSSSTDWTTTKFSLPSVIFLCFLFISINRLLARLHEVQKSYCSHPGRTRSRYRYRSRSRSRHTLLKFSRSLYLDNQLSESIHTWTIGTL